MNKFLIAVLLLIALTPRPSLFAEDPFGHFKEYADRASFKPFTRDLGSLLGSASFHSGRSLGFSGFDLGAHLGMQFRPDKNNTALRRGGTKTFGIPFVQGEIGLPLRMDGFIRGISYQGITIAGGGLRYGLFRVTDQVWKPQVLVATIGHSVSHRDFSASHFGADLVVSISHPIFTPYLGAGFDRTRVVARAADADPTIVGEVATTMEPRYTGGFSLRPFPEKSQYHFLYIQSALTMAHGEPGLDAGFGLRF